MGIFESIKGLFDADSGEVLEVVEHELFRAEVSHDRASDKVVACLQHDPRLDRIKRPCICLVRSHLVFLVDVVEAMSRWDGVVHRESLTRFEE